MISECEDLLIADFAEYYGVIDYRLISPEIAASLAIGLRPESRVLMHFTDSKITFDRLLMSQILDSLNILIWQNTKDGHRGRNKPKSLYKELTKKKEKKEELEVFAEADDYLAWRKSKGM